MAVDTTITALTPEAWTPLNAGSAAAGNVSLFHKSGSALLILVSASSAAPTYNQATVDAAFRLEPSEEIIGTTCALLSPGAAAPTYLYAAPADGAPGSVKLSAA
jgi:hypothetical protein